MTATKWFAASTLVLAAHASFATTLDHTNDPASNHGDQSAHIHNTQESSTKPATLYATPNTQKLYGEMFDLIAPHAPDLNVMIVTADDLDPEQNYKKQNWHYQEAVIMGCEIGYGQRPDQQTEKTQQELVAKGVHRLKKMFSEYTSNEDPFITENEYEQTDFKEYLRETVIYTFANIPAAGSLRASFPDIETKSTIVTMPSEYISAQEITGAQQIFPEKLWSLSPMAYETSFLVLAHEIGGHGHSEHGHHETSSILESPCRIIDTTYLDDSNIFETDADIAAANIYKKSIPVSAKLKNLDALRQGESIRAFEGLAIVNNLYNARSSFDLNDHLTTIGFDPTQSGSRSDFNVSSLPEHSVLPAMINVYADTIVGYMTRLRLPELAPVLDVHISRQMEGLPLDPKAITGQEMLEFAFLGSNMRFGSNDIISKQAYHATIKLLHEGNYFDSLKQKLKPEYAKAVDEIITDYLESVEHIVPGLINTKMVNAKNTLFDQIDFEQITQTLFYHDLLENTEMIKETKAMKFAASLNKDLGYVQTTIEVCEEDGISNAVISTIDGEHYIACHPKP